MNNLGIRYSEVGRREDALAPAEEAAQICRRLAQANPAAYEPDLAMSLWSVAWICDRSRLAANVGLGPGREAIALFTALSRRYPDVFSARLQAVVETVSRLETRDDNL